MEQEMQQQLDEIKIQLQEEAKNYPLMRRRMNANEKGLVYCANRVIHMMKFENCDFSGACAWLESELEGMD